MKTSDFDYQLPPHLIAQTPIEPRDRSRLLVMDLPSHTLAHHHFFDLPQLLTPGDLLVFNDSRVFPARLYGESLESGRPVELLMLSSLQPGVWRALVKPGRRMRRGAEFTVGTRATDQAVRGEVLDVEDSGTRIVRFEDTPDLDSIGIIPLPPYIHRPLADAERYQTVYSQVEGSVAAPTAGLHFTRGLLDELDQIGVDTAFVTLHVGWDSFRPLRSEDPSDHDMHSEYWELTAETANLINTAKADGRRVISVGTTAVRLLENAAAINSDPDRLLYPGSGWVDLFIKPGFEFKVIDALITNFHLPRSTLLMLVSAFAGREQVLYAYREAVMREYRFYSFGDAMLIQR